MKLRPLILVLSLGLLAVMLAMVGSRHQQLSGLRSHARELQSSTEALANVTPAGQEASKPVVAEYSSPSLELLRLRSQVGQLERRRRELAVVPGENKRLQAQLAAKATNGTGGVALPAGYMRKSEARSVGFGSPEDSVQSFLWAIEHRDMAILLQFFGPDQARQMAAEVEKRGSAEDFFKEAGNLPGMLIAGRETKADGTVELKVQMIPNDEATTQKARFQQFDGQWRLVSGGF